MQDMFLDDQFIHFNALCGLQCSNQAVQDILFDTNKKQSEKIKNSEGKIKKQSSTNNLEPNKNNKNKYINKIQAMAKESRIQSGDQKPTTINMLSRKTSRSYSTFNANLIKQDEQSEKDIDDPERKLSRNRTSAKQSRQRKKLYIDLLQRQISKLQAEKNELNKQIQLNKTQINKFLHQNQTLNGLSVGKQNYVKKLQKLIQSKQQSDHQEINVILDSLSMRIGATGKTRLNLVNQYFKQVLNLAFPALYRYLLWSASQSRHLFAQTPETQQEWYKFSEFQVNQDLIKKLIKSKQKISNYKQVFSVLVEKLMALKRKLYQQQEILENLMDIFRNILTPVQCAKIVVFIEKNKYKEQISFEYQLKRKHSQIKQSEDLIDEVFKKRKIQ